MPEKYSRGEYEKVMEPFFTRNKNFYRNFFHLVLMVALQNLVAYSVNMLDNMMLGSYSQNALSRAATVNQIFFVINQLAIAVLGKRRYRCNPKTDRYRAGVQHAGGSIDFGHLCSSSAAVDRIIYNIFGNYRRRAGVSWHIKMDVCAVFDQ